LKRSSASRLTHSLDFYPQALEQRNFSLGWYFITPLASRSFCITYLIEFLKSRPQVTIRVNGLNCHFTLNFLAITPDSARTKL
ncbi:MAG: hypothetical protein ABL927_12090, partial [Bdellovibrionales bacterium]